jgi:uncharacterized membrane protein YgdD (TMEM256/DUF423 family)
MRGFEGRNMARVFLALGGVFGFLTVLMAAISAHALPGRLDAKGLEAVRSAVQMQGWHAIALVLTALWMLRAGPAALGLALYAGWAFAIGTVLFSGSIYAGALAGLRLGPRAPTGGLLLMAGWLLLTASALRARAGGGA